MFLTLTSIFCASYFLSITEGLADCNFATLRGSQCRKITECGPWINELKGADIDISKYLNRRTCGFEGNIPKICCPLNDPYSGVPDLDSRITDGDKSNNCGNILWNKNLTPDGHPADLDEFPWLALLQYETSNGIRFGCGGVLISDRYVLTAAHCIDLTMKLTSVRLGEYNINTVENCIRDGPNAIYCTGNAIEVGVEKEIPHEKYDFFRGPSDFSSNSYDIALLRLNRTVIADHIKPICLPIMGPEPNRITNGKFLSAGWGAEPFNYYMKSSMKRMARLKKVEKKHCEHSYKTILQDDLICALAKSKHVACVGDSGGPLMSFNRRGRMTVVGIFSPVGPGPCTKNGMPGTYTDVRLYKDWINAHME